MSVLNKELWLPLVVEKLYDGFNQMSGIATDDSSFLIKSGNLFRKTYIPNAGSLGSLTINDNTLALTPSKRADYAVEYSLDKYELGPHLVDREAVLSTSYDKINSVLNGMVGKASEGIAYQIRKGWFMDDFAIDTSGSGTTATFGTGNRKQMVYGDILLAKKKLDAQKMPLTDRFLILSSTHANDVLEDLFTEGYNVRWTEKDNMTILDQKILGFTIVQMPVCLFGEVSGTTISALDYEVEAEDDDNLVEISLAYHKDFVSMAKDDAYLFYDEDSPVYRGDVITLQSFAGSALREADGLGCIPIVGAIA